MPFGAAEEEASRSLCEGFVTGQDVWHLVKIFRGFSLSASMNPTPVGPLEPSSAITFERDSGREANSFLKAAEVKVFFVFSFIELDQL